MIGKYKIITLCGSSKFRDDLMIAQETFTLEGYIVINLGVFGHAEGITWDKKTKDMLDDMHKRKIDLADEIFVVNPKGYIGESTRSEIDYAIETGKKVNYLNPE